MNTQQIIQQLLEQQILLAPDVIGDLPENFNPDLFIETTKKIFKNAPLIINKDLFSIIIQNKKAFDINWPEFDTSRTGFEKGKKKEYLL